MNGQFPAVLGIVGPTAAGKSDIALDLAWRFSGEIVICDSVQVFRGLDIGSAKPTAEERKKVPHHLVDAFPPDCPTDVARYKELAESAIRDILSRGRLPVVCGGTGLYFNSLYFGLTDAPGRNDTLRAELEERAAREGLESLRRELEKLDPDSAAGILPGDKRRLIRALEVCRLSGRKFSGFRAENRKLDLNWRVIGIRRDRAELVRRIEDRVDAMIAAGLAEETRSLMSGFGPGAYALGSIGYRHARSFLNGECSGQEFAETLKRDTRRYAKRQMTWFRKNRDIVWFDAGDRDGISREVERFLANRRDENRAGGMS